MRVARLLEAAALSVIALALLGAMAWRADGGHWERVETPSMGSAAPVGTLLWVKPVAFDRLAVGDIVTFRAPGVPGTVSHRIRAVNSDLTISTAGDLSGNDPWRIGPDDVVGRVTHEWQGVGWLVSSAPILLLGGGMLGLVVRFASRPRWRLPVTIVGTSVVLCVVIVTQRPLVRAEQVSFVAAEAGAQATYVATGLLPIKLSSPSGDHVELAAGHVGTVMSRTPDESGSYSVDITAHLPRGWWLLVVLACFVPALGASLADRRGRPRRRHGG
ncbi:MAG: S26 family signal peptidase [Nocardioides sp.]